MQKTSTGLVLYVKYDPATGAFKDFSRNRHTIANTDVVPTRGKFGAAGSYNGSTSYLDCGNDTSLNLSDAITILAWVKMPSSVADKEISCKNYGDTKIPFRLYTDVNGKPKFASYDGGSLFEIISPRSLSTGVWYHVVGAFDKTLASDNAKIYVNGILKIAGDCSNPLPINDELVLIGDYQFSVNSFSGTIDEVRIYNWALSAAQITKHYMAKSYYGGAVNAPIPV